MDGMTVSGRRVLVLWDVDHTLIENGGVSKANYRRAFKLLTGRDPDVPPRTDGRTDVGIMQDLLSANGVALEQFPAAERLGALERAGRDNASEQAQRGYALAGASSVLRYLAARPEVVQSVLTGNIEANAVVKLAAFGLDKWIDFRVGGYGETYAERGRLVAVAQGKATEWHGFDPAREVTVVIGDTARDVAAGLFGGAKVVGVATGEATVDELRAAGAHDVLADLADTAAVVEAIGRVSEVRLSVPASGSTS
jgi:phosphoglycolate phosphatase